MGTIYFDIAMSQSLSGEKALNQTTWGVSFLGVMLKRVYQIKLAATFYYFFVTIIIKKVGSIHCVIDGYKYGDTICTKRHWQLNGKNTRVFPHEHYLNKIAHYQNLRRLHE